MKGTVFSWKQALRGVVLAWLVALPATVLHAQELDGETLAFSLRPNVVRITTEWADGSTGPSGFGFIVGERDEDVGGERKQLLYIVTAEHVALRTPTEEEPDNPNPVVKWFVRFFHQKQTSYEATFVERHDERDLALLMVDKPGGNFNWVKSALAPPESIVRNKDVWFIGRGSDWYVPTGSNVGTVNRKRAEFIDVDISSVRPGTSGALFITEDGIIGMVFQDDDAVTASALSIDFIKGAFDPFNIWETYPWDLHLLGEEPINEELPQVTQFSIRSLPDAATVRLGAVVGTTPFETTLDAGRTYTLIVEKDNLVPAVERIDARPGVRVLREYMLVPFDTLSEASEARLTNVRFIPDPTGAARVVVQYDLMGESDKKYKVELTLVDARGETVQAPLGERKGDFGKVLPGRGKRIDWQPVQPFLREVAAVRLTVKRYRSSLAYILGVVGGGALAGIVGLVSGGGGTDPPPENGGFPMPPPRPGGQ